MNNILIIGSGGRECAIVRKLAQSSSKPNIFYYGTHQNPIMDNYAKCIGISSLSNIGNIIKVASENNITCTFIGPEEPWRDGIVDAFRKMNKFCIGPTSKLAEIECSKIFARKLMTNSGLSKYCPEYKEYYPNDKSYINFIKNNTNNTNIVIKADGIHGGKGVKVFGDHLINVEQCIEFCEEIHRNNEPFLIEEKLVGEEFSFMSFCDGYDILHTIPIKDFKRVYDNDKGPNTGSMGSITEYGNTLSFLTNDDIMTCKNINSMVYHELQNTCNDVYNGILYGSFMKTDKGIKVIEYNARFGDPECINLLELMENDLVDIFSAMKSQTLQKINLKFNQNASIFKYIVPQDYPIDPIKGEEVVIPTENRNILIGSSLGQYDNRYVELGSRTLGYILVGKDLNNLANESNKLLSRVSGPLFYRKDIGITNTTNTYIQNKYSESGVNIEEGNNAVKKIKSYVESTFNNNVISRFGDFSGLFRLSGYKKPVLVSTTDGVGTKSILVIEKYGAEVGFQMLGQDIVNHCINDMLVKGAKPLFFLDYFAASKLNSDHVAYFVKGISEACRKVNCVLIGGETAEMPSVYNQGHTDVVGTMIGIVEEDEIIDGKRDIKKGDLAVAFQSSGPHTNGYSLIRKIVKDIESKYGEIDKVIIDKLCATHKSYLPIYESIVSENIKINGMVHITGGGFEDNIPRVLPDNLKLVYNNYKMPMIFEYIQKMGNITDQEMRKVFNCGIGMIMFMDNNNYEKLIKMNNVHDHIIIGYVE